MLIKSKTFIGHYAIGSAEFADIAPPEKNTYGAQSTIGEGKLAVPEPKNWKIDVRTGKWE